MRRRTTVLKEAYGAIPEIWGENHRILFRLDDDDALDGGYVARCKRLAGGFSLQASAETPLPSPLIAASTLFAKRPATRRGGQLRTGAARRAPRLRPVSGKGNPYRYNHRKFAQHYPLFSDIAVPSFLRTVHGDNHSTPAMMGLTRQTEAEIDADLQTILA